MKTLILLFTLLSFSYCEQYTFLVNKYDKEVELEAEIIFSIASSSLDKDIKLFIPEISNSEKEIYSKIFTLADSCSNANFIFVKKSMNISSCKSDKKIFFTNNYQRLLENNNYFGAFFWNKSRPNIIFIKNRLSQQNIKLPVDYEKFIEDIR